MMLKYDENLEDSTFIYNLRIGFNRNKYYLFLKEYKWLIFIFIMIEISLVFFAVLQNAEIFGIKIENSIISNELIGTFIISILTTFTVILGLFENRRQSSKKVI